MLGSLLTPERRALGATALLDQAKTWVRHPSAYLSRRTRALHAMVGLIVIVSITFLPHGHVWRTWFSLIAIVTLFFVASAVRQYRVGARHAWHIAAYKVGLPLCTKCCYDLRGSPMDKPCPECGTPWPDPPEGVPAYTGEQGVDGSG